MPASAFSLRSASQAVVSHLTDRGPRQLAVGSDLHCLRRRAGCHHRAASFAAPPCRSSDSIGRRRILCLNADATIWLVVAPLFLLSAYAYLRWRPDSWWVALGYTTLISFSRLSHLRSGVCPCHTKRLTMQWSERPPAARSRFAWVGRRYCGPRALRGVAHFFLLDPEPNAGTAPEDSFSLLGLRSFAAHRRCWKRLGNRRFRRSCSLSTFPGILLAVPHVPPEGIPAQNPPQAALMLLAQVAVWFTIFTLVRAIRLRRTDANTRQV